MFTIEYVKDLQWENSEHTLLSCIVKYKEFNEEHPTGVDGLDQYPHVKEIWVKANSGAYGVISEYIPPPPPKAKPVEEQPITEGTQEL
jgi:hypothetical protein